MIQKLIIENFQSHEKAELNLDPGVNIITGVSLSGKTAILRALYWLLHNRPSGDRFRSTFAEGATKVMIETSEGERIWHVKDSKINSYVAGDTVFDKIGKEIPDMVQRALRVSELNVQRQLDKPFLITSSAGEVAKTINRITRLEMVDNWVTDLTQSINSINREKDQLEAQIESHTEKIKSYRVLVELQPLLNRAKEIDNRQDELSDLRSKISYLVRDIEDHESDSIYHREQTNKLGLILGKINLVTDQVKKLTERAKVARSAVRAYRYAQRLKTALEPLEKSLEIQDRMTLLAQKSKIIGQTLNQSKFLATAQKYQDSCKTQLKAALQKSKLCPTCDQPITDKVVNKILGEI